MKLSHFLVPAKIRQWRALLQEKGFKAVLKEAGWKVIAAVIVFYLIRDTFLYIILPFLIARGLIGD
ncbi:MAG: hypothetical protein Q9P90_04130 [candidate division KSB1 bacterium]|nr:hypothetical protein [candidate division KSB1 bacterium]